MSLSKPEIVAAAGVGSLIGLTIAYMAYVDKHKDEKKPKIRDSASEKKAVGKTVLLKRKETNTSFNMGGISSTALA